ncbi:MAG: Dihydroorotate dehydrogenase B (NAD(+)), electron transfer subunit [Firmicutes bacterium ADurb.Bin248]|nr:MAG: Dihydroorotate dehydrogenase B (NAD(+)), electron transfer subunit [Firmicutes bacterium ADurb.Bin248]HOF99778.1 sulfide/dihydroorotate dehydrogenase-like FAD/NAD-binding protein [Clostridia bacterium]HPK14680.1 sulfide/dihydroorotate dehydrogenase-like FAD/NAD-binding protein [Clostridia bacterium]
MYRILKKRTLSPNVKLMAVDAPHVAKKALAGQFIMLRVDETGERIPLTIADYDRQTGAVTIIFQEVGKTTKLLGTLEEGDSLADFVGPLGVPSHFEGVKHAAVIGGGLGTAIAYPQAKALKEHGAKVDMIVGFRNRELIMLEDEFAAASDRLYVATDDGSNGRKGFVSDVLRELLEAGETYDLVVAIGPVMMMKVVSDLTRPYGIRTVVSMNSIMVDGTGMCGCCRLTVGGETKFACVDGPDFDGHQVDFDEALRRGAMYRKEEAESLGRHVCRLTGEVRNA